MNKNDVEKSNSALICMKKICNEVSSLQNRVAELKGVKKNLSTIKGDDFVDQAKDCIDSIIDNLECIQTNIDDSIDMLESIEED